MNKIKSIDELKRRMRLYENKEPDPEEERERIKRTNESYRIYQTLRMINKCSGDCTCCKVIQVFQEGNLRSTPNCNIGS